MKDRRLMKGLTTADFSRGYLRMVEPWCLEKPWYMLGDHGYYSPIMFR